MYNAALLYEAAMRIPTKTGCVPAWTQLLSDSTVPIHSCDKVHAFLSRQPRASFLSARECLPNECGCNNRVPKQWRS